MAGIGSPIVNHARSEQIQIFTVFSAKPSGAAQTSPRRYNAGMAAKDYTTDTSDEALAVQLECIRRMTPQERLRKACALSSQVRKMALDAIRRLEPGLAEEGVQLRFIELAYGRRLAEEVAKWKAERRGE